MLQDLFAFLLATFVIGPFEADMADKLALGRAPLVVLTEMQGCVRAAAPVLGERALGDWLWVATSTIGIWIGIAIAFAGGVSWDNLDRRMLLGDAFGVLAGACWGATTVVVRASRLSEAPVTLTLFYQLLVGFVGLLLIALFSGQITHVSLTTVAVASVLFQGLVVSFFSYLIWFWLLRRYLAANLAVFSFMTPLFGVTFGVLLLGEQLTVNFVVGAVLVLLGITFVSAEQWLRRRLRKALGQR